MSPPGSLVTEVLVTAAAAVGLLATGCGSVSGDADAAPANDAAADAEPGAPDAAPGPSCWNATFATPGAVGGVNTTANEAFGRLSADQLTIVFAREDAPMIASRASTADPFGTPTALTITGNGTDDVLAPTMTADKLAIYFTSSRTGSRGLDDLWRATRPTTAADFGALNHQFTASSADDERDAYVLPDGSALYFSSSRINTSTLQIWRASIDGGGGVVDPVHVAELDDGAETVSTPVVSADELTIFMQRAGVPHQARRARTDLPFEASVALTVLDSPDNDFPTWISEDGCTLYLMSFRNAPNAFDLYVTTRAPA